MFNFCASPPQGLADPLCLACLSAGRAVPRMALTAPPLPCVPLTHLVTQVLFLPSVKCESVTSTPALLGRELLKQGLPGTRHCHWVVKPL